MPLEQFLPKLLPFVNLPPAMGRVFFVDPVSGNDANHGGAPDQAFATTAFALTQCVANRNDVIVRMPGTEVIDEDIAPAAIAMNVRGVTLIGVQGGNPWDIGETCAYYRYSVTAGWGTNSGTGPVFHITEPCTIIGIEAVVDQIYAAQALNQYGAAVEINGDAGGFNGSFNHIAYCRFTGFGGVESLGIVIHGAAYNLIEHCVFEEMSGAGARSGGVLISAGVQNSNYNRILKCQLRNMVNGVEQIAGVRRTYIEECVLDELTGQGITGTAVCIDGHAFGNYFGMTITAPVAAGWAYDALLAARDAVGFHCAGNSYREGNAAGVATDPTA